MGNFNHQQFWVTGSRFFFQRDPIAGVRQPIIDFGVIDVANPAFEKEQIELEDGDGGVKRVVDDKVIAVTETYDITCFNLNPEMIALLFSSDPPSALTQAATQKTDIKHYAHPGRLLKILDADYDSATEPRFTLGVTTVDAINSAAGGAGTAYTEGDDWEYVSKERGLIRMLESGDFAAAGDLYVTYTPRAISGNRLIVPTSGFTSNTRGRGMLVWGREDNAQQTARIAEFSVVSQTPAFAIDNYSSIAFQLKVLADVEASEPVGRIEYWVGDLPDLS